ncbi:FAD-linked oxidoreductase-like protein [Ilyonectria robusta]|uniref:FAD-linked oxidoreductase-like protein n=1 Tax=Ilyonectria robusta TaxID=1079257 RepID=UPI001E8E3C21|nr:FAD-linked oxidoreductase-like protein [Ilyonectria robusta]KAH8734459.1 FAD-linked oxidoreductase-like protein [Ilyonectria robusta]
MSKPWLLRPSLAIMELVVNSKSALLNADKNPALNRLLRWAVYNHFCAGTNSKESLDAVKNTKKLGYHGVILGYAREVVLDPVEALHHTPSEGAKYGQKHYEVVDEWKMGNVETLDMLDAGDFLAVKLTGAGQIALDALQDKQPMPEYLEKAVDEICGEARKRGCRLWFDAEQQALQPTLDEWAIATMRKHNRGGKDLMYNTIQGYLKGSRANAERHLTLAAQEGFTVAVKLVRGAYIENEIRSLIHDTKEDTDRCYDDIADMFISRRMPEAAKHLDFPSATLFLGTHNAASAEKAIQTHKQRVLAGLPLTPLECGQILGMADELSCKLLQDHEKDAADSRIGGKSPRILKAFIWGSVGECMGYLYRRTVENRGAVERTQHMAEAMRKEVRRRIFG